MQHDEMDESELLQRGAMARRILQDAELIGFFLELQNDFRTASFNTVAEQSEIREEMWAKHNGVEEILTLMRDYAERAADLIGDRT